ncbi:unnamed protein product [Schistosoma bovis]|nr:unnamed protein product [Schistosoma bovis]
MPNFGIVKNTELMNTSDLSSDTPVTRLSKILSKANFLEVSKTKTAPKLHQISEIIPPDIDESANQEPPTTSVWSEAPEFFVREHSNSCSSGYYSGATTHSAPASSICERFYEINADRDPPISLIRSVYETTESAAPGDSTLRRAHSCSSRGWLAKRHNRQQWPRISGISRERDTSLVGVANTDTNSCPAAIIHDNNPCNLRRYSLPPVGESGSGSTSEASPPRDHLVSFLTSAKSPSPEKRMECSSSLLHPIPKKQRIESPKETDCNSTIPTEELNENSEHDNIGSLFSNPNGGPKPFFELLRHHSTPMPSSYSYKHCPSSPVEVFNDENINKPRLSRCLSETHSVSYDAIARCIGSLSSHSLCSDGRRARALPVVDRTGSGLHCVSTDTVGDLISGSKRNINYVIVDCRFPYEYEGGHIKGAINIFTHSDLVQEIFNRVPAQRPPGTSGPPRFLGEDLARRLATTQREPLSAPCELISDDEDEDEFPENTTSEISDSDLAYANDEVILEKNIHSDSPKSEPDLSYVSSGLSNISESSNQDPPFVVIFHCEFSSQRAPALAAFLRSVDRVSNYHRYPFLYFPEIYIMKGGYSAFYRKFPHLCTPQEYVKMFHRDYRNHLRLYKRLTRRVSSACMACIKPQQNEVDKSQIPVSEVDSYCQLPLNLKVGVHNMFTTHEPPTYQFRSDRELPMHEDNSISGLVNYENKENYSPSGSELCSKSQSHHSCSADNVNEEPKHAMLSPNVEGCNQASSSVVDSPLGLAEVVVRVGRRVIAATLGSTSNNCSEVARALDRIKYHNSPQIIQPLEGKPPVRCLKRSLTTNSLDIRHQIIRPKVFNPFCGGNSYSQNTPSIRRVRTNSNTDLLSVDNTVNSILAPTTSTTSNQIHQVQSSPQKEHLSYHSLSTCSE